jgi:hypothetical protein
MNKRITYAETILDILHNFNEPIGQAKLVNMAIEKNPPVSKYPKLVYYGIIAKLAREGRVIVNKSKGQKKESWLISPS